MALVDWKKDTTQVCSPCLIMDVRHWPKSDWRAIIAVTFSSIAILLGSSGCATPDVLPKPLLIRIQNAAPDKGTATPLALDGPFRRPIKKIASLNGRLAFLIKDAPGPGIVGFYVTDTSGVWTWRDSTPDVPTMLSSGNGNYWVANSKGFAAFNPSSGIFAGSPPPADGNLRELVSFDDHVVGVAGTNKIVTAKRGSPWTTLATLANTETLIGIADTGSVLCALSSSSRKVWISTRGGTKWSNKSTIAANYGELLQLATGQDRTYILTNAALLMGDAECANWSAITAPVGSRPYNSIAVSGPSVFLATDDGAFGFDGNRWKRLEIDPTRSVVRGLRFLNDRLYACHDSGLDESVDFGDHWEPSASPLDHGIAVIDIRSTLSGEYVGTKAGLFHRNSYKDNWNQVALPGDQKGSIGALETTRDGTVLVALTRPDSGDNASIFRSLKGESAFEDITGDLNTQKVTRLVWTNFGTFAATDNGVSVLLPSEKRWRLDRAGMGDNSIIALAQYGVYGLLAASDTTVWWRTDARNLNAWRKLNPTQSFFGISDIWSDPTYPEIIYVATPNTLLFTTSPHDLFQAYAFRPERHPVPASIRLSSFTESSGRSVLFLGTNFGAYFVYDDLGRHGWVGRIASTLERYQHDYSDRIWFWPVTVVGGFLSAYTIGICCLLLLLAVEMPPIVGRSWLLTLIAKPLTISPALGRWALFLGYRRRLRKMPSFATVRNNYFGLSARLPDDKQTAPDSSGQVLHAHILKQLNVKNCLLLLGRPGTGKTSVLSKLAILAGEKASLYPLSKVIPVFIPAEFYKGNFVEAASRVLSERHGLPLDSTEMLRGQIEFGRMLFLFDGLSEVSSDRKDAAFEIAHTASLAEFRKSYFIISSRFFEGLPEIPPIELLPLTQEAIKDVYLPSYQLSAAKEEAVLQQLAQFGRNTPIDALLFAMIISAAQSQTTSMTRSQLYEKYFRQVLKVEGQEKESEWLGWKYFLERIAGWFCLSTGRRAQGLVHFELMDLLLGKVPAQDATDAMAPRLRQYYGIKGADEIDLLQRLSSAGILSRGTHWRFSHDSFEEYFCAQRLISIIEQTKQAPDLQLWYQDPDDFLDIVKYFRESAPEEVRRVFFSRGQLPNSWLTVNDCEP